MNFNGKNILITGGTRGIGKQIALDFLRNGANVFITGTGKKPVLDKNINYLQVDFSNKKSLELFIKKISNIHIDILVNNAGINIIKPIEDVTSKDYDELFNVNLKAPYFICKAVGQIMKKNNSGKIINIASIWSKVSKPNRTLYVTSKNALVGLTQTLAIEFASYNILVNSVSPGFTDTELTKKSLTTKELSILKKQIPLKRLAKTNEISELVTFLSSDKNTYITGQNIVIDGGYTII